MQVKTAGQAIISNCMLLCTTLREYDVYIYKYLKLAEDVMLDESRQLLGLGSRSPNPQECKAVLAFYSSAIDCLVCAAHPKGGEQKGGSVTHAATDIPCRRLHAAQFVEQTSHRGECQMKKAKRLLLLCRIRSAWCTVQVMCLARMQTL